VDTSFFSHFAYVGCIWQKDIHYEKLKFQCFKHLPCTMKVSCDAHTMSMVLQSTAQPNNDTTFVFEQQNISHEIQRAVSGALSPAVNKRR
jgi:hypothetical protein